MFRLAPVLGLYWFGADHLALKQGALVVADWGLIVVSVIFTHKRLSKESKLRPQSQYKVRWRACSATAGSVRLHLDSPRFDVPDLMPPV